MAINGIGRPSSYTWEIAVTICGHLANEEALTTICKSADMPSRRTVLNWLFEDCNADFVHKLKIALKELNETNVWLRMVCRAGLKKTKLLEELIDENQQLCRILNASVKTAKTKMTNDD